MFVARPEAESANVTVSASGNAPLNVPDSLRVNRAADGDPLHSGDPGESQTAVGGGPAPRIEP